MMVQVTTRARHREIGETFGAGIESDLDALGMKELSGEAFDFFRKWRRDETSIRKFEESLISSGEDREPLNLADRVSREPWLRLRVEVLRDLFFAHKKEFDVFLNEYNNIKSKATHVLAVFRPFNEKYLKEWSSFFDTYPLDEVKSQAEKLRLETVSDKFDLNIWATAVYDLFRSSAVFDQSFEQKNVSLEVGRGQKRLPQGMISSTSERIYGQQWRLWFRENEDEIMQFLAPRSEAVIDRLQEAIDVTEFVQDDIEDTIYKTTVASAEKKDASEPYPMTKGSEISIRASVASMPELTSTETWVNTEYSEKELQKWLALMEDVWGLKGKPVAITVSLKSDVKSSDFTLRPMPTSEAISAIRSVLKQRN
jgi:hypothetical protein